MTRPIEATLEALSRTAFPANVVEYLAGRFESLDLGINVVRRTPRPEDANYTLGIVATNKVPDPDSTEIRGNSFVGPTAQTFVITLYAFVKDAEEARGLSTHSVFAELIESMLVDDAGTRAGLGILKTVVIGITKRVGRFWIRQTRYLTSEIPGNHIYASATELIVEVEKSR